VYRHIIPAPTYWGKRKHLAYYREVLDVARTYALAGGSVIDVGAGNTQVIDALAWFSRRIVLDRCDIVPRPGVERIVMDFMEYRPHASFDLVLCLQVLEHLDDPAAFARKLLGSGMTLVLSVPYRWPAGISRNHKHDPIDEAKLLSWIGQEPIETRIIKNGRERLIAVYRGHAR
jgi:SAM-dependent methyltransferase